MAGGIVRREELGRGVLPSLLDNIVNLLVPELQERGGYRTEYSGSTLREHLGLREPLTRRNRCSR